MENEINLLNMTKVEAPKIDVSKHIGKFIKISDVNVIETKFGIAIKVETEIVETIKKDDGDNIEIKATRIFSISKEGEIIVNSKLDKFMQKYKVEQPAHLIGIEVQLLKNEKEFLTF